MSTSPPDERTRTGPAAAGTAVLVVAVTWTFLPLDGLASFDVVKLPVLLLGAGLLLLWSGLRGRVPLRRDPLFLLPAALAVVALAAGVLAGRPGTLRGPLLACGALAAGVAVVRAGDPVATIRTLARGVVVAALGAALYGLVQFLGGDPAPWGARRLPVSTLGNVSFAAEFQAAALPAALFLLVRPKRSWERVLGAAATAAVLGHVALTRSRIDVIAVLAVFGWFVVWRLRAAGRRRLATGLCAALLVAAAALAALFVAHGTGALDVPFLGRSDTVAVRVHIYGALLGALSGGALLLPSGVAFAERYAALRPAEEYVISLGRTVATAHNDLLGMATHLGLPLALVGGACVALLLRRLWSGDDAPAERFFASGTLVALLVSGLASTPLGHTATALLGGVAWGAALSLSPAGRELRPGLARWSLVGAAALAGIALVPATRALRSETFLALARQALAADNGAETLRLLDVAAASDERAFAPRRELGALHVNLHEAEAAERVLRDALVVRPSNPESRADLARALFQQERFDEGGELLAASLAICPWHPELLAARAQLALHQGRAADAVSDLSRAAETHRHEPRMAALLAEARLAAREPGAQEDALDVVKRLFAGGDHAHGMRTIPRMLTRDPSFLAALVATARRLVRDDPETAAQMIAAAAEHAPAGEDVGFLEEGGQVLIRAGREDAGRRFIGHSLGLRAEDALRRGQTQEALSLAQQAIPRDPDPRHYVTSARALARLGDRRAAVRAVGSALALGRVDPARLRDDPDIAGLLPDEELELILERAALRLGEEAVR